MDWLKRNKDDHRALDQYLKHHVPDAECRIYATRQKDFVLRRNLLYLRVMPKKSNEDVLVFVVPGVETSGGARWVPLLFGASGQGPHAKPAEGKVLVAGHGPKDDDERS